MQKLRLKTTCSFMPDLVQIQRDSYFRFLKSGLVEELNAFSPIIDYTGRLEFHILTKNIKFRSPKYTLSSAKKNEQTYSTQIYIPIKIVDKNFQKEYFEDVFIGDFPLMTDRGTFVINGIERIIVNQIIRSPGVFYKVDKDKLERQTYNLTFIPYRGSWLRIELDKNNLIWVRIDKTKRISAFLFLKALGLTNDKILDNLKYPSFFLRTIHDLENREGISPFISKDEAIVYLYNILRQGEPATLTVATKFLYSKFFDPKRYDIGTLGRRNINKKLALNIPETVTTLTPQDFLSAIEYLINLEFGSGFVDDIDDLSNRRVRSVGELLCNQVRVGMGRLERVLKERMVSNFKYSKSGRFFNPKPIMAAVKEFFCLSSLSQFMDQTNPLSELTHKRRISSIGPGGISREHSGFGVRDIHPSHYGRICPVETPEGQNAGLVSSLATYGRVDSYGILETPYMQVKQGQILDQNSFFYLSSDQEENLTLAAGDTNFDKNGFIKPEELPVRYQREFFTVSRTKVDFLAVSPIQIFSIASSLIPFLEHDDANRALMGSNMQRQAVPLLYPERPFVGTGLESNITRDSSMVIVNQNTGIVKYVSADTIVIKSKKDRITYTLEKYKKSNQETCITQKPIVWVGERVEKGQILTEGTASCSGELALGKNILLAYMPWEGYNYEDAFMVSERLVLDDIYTSLHIEKFEIEVKQTKAGPEELTKSIAGISERNSSILDDSGIVKLGTFVDSGYVIVGKLTPKEEEDQSPEGKLLRAIFGERERNVRDTSLKVPNGVKGRILDIRTLSRDKGDDLPPGINQIIRVFLVKTRKIRVGDKMAGRHGNKGIISCILPTVDMPFLPDGTPIDVVLNPLGIPSRMNVGQIFECLLGFAAEHLNKFYRVMPFDEMHSTEASRILINNKLKEASLLDGKSWVFNSKHPGKQMLVDGRTGTYFDNPITVGRSYMLKLIHLVDDKLHARSTGPYSLVTQQPLGGKAQHGGQRLGEMEVWALEAFGAAYTLQELLTVKSDDMDGRNEMLNSIVKGRDIPKPGIPESFKVLMRELQSLSLDISAYKVVSDGNQNFEATEVDLITPSKFTDFFSKDQIMSPDSQTTKEIKAFQILESTITNKLNE
uniref:DNA-directed RNA polymerase subunit beta n=2 Tax=Pavlovaceae TaxID=418969 RepID=M1K3V7_DIALT|nr:RNA polymerase subunit beta [Diacronema lutheri]YP_009863809.1 RNA polymerase beta-subunit [Pavlova sp. NIVA-4/92]AGE93786.1 RNA polymerase subunit beta [Diacronema lutheri]QKE31140.1 RNA polymerase beta-subunit [Pavlova sp. NIVA-4/92]